MKGFREIVAFDAPVAAADGRGGRAVEWEERFKCRAGFKYERGKESVIGGGLTGTATFKVCIRMSMAARDVTTDYRMRDLIRNVSFQIREVDFITDRQYVWIGVESGVAI